MDVGEWFRRHLRKRKSDASNPPAAQPSQSSGPRSSDASFPFLTLSEAARLRRLVRTSMADRGRECTVEGDALIDADGTTYGLWNLARAVADLDREEWAGVIDNHVRIVMSGSGLDKLSAVEAKASIRARLVELDGLPFLDGLPHARALAPGLIEILTFDLPETVVTPTSGDTAELGETDELIALGRANLRSVLDEVETRRVDAEDGLSFSFVLGDSFYVASAGLVLQQLLDRVAPGEDLRKGVFVGVPNRHHLAFRVVSDLPSLMSVGPMAAFCRDGYETGAGPVSPHVYWVHGPQLEEWRQLTTQSDEGITITVDPELTALVEED